MWFLPNPAWLAGRQLCGELPHEPLNFGLGQVPAFGAERCGHLGHKLVGRPLRVLPALSMAVGQQLEQHVIAHLVSSGEFLGGEVG